MPRDTGKHVVDLRLSAGVINSLAGFSIQIMHIREAVSKNYSPRGNFIKV